jgi:IclR helix-turn-helix domain
MKLDTNTDVKSADRVFDILEYVADAAEPPSFSQMTSDLNIPRSSLFPLLNTLHARHYLEQDPETDRYRIGQQSQQDIGPPLMRVVAIRPSRCTHRAHA